jgi:hypothetical protein
MNDGGWKLWREASGFWQCYTGVFSGDGRTVEGGREGSAEGLRWKHDFDLNYMRPGVTGPRPVLEPAAIRRQRRGGYGPVD